MISPNIPPNLRRAREVVLQKGRNHENTILRFLKAENRKVTQQYIMYGCDMKRGTVLAGLKRLIAKKKVYKTMIANYQRGKMIAYYEVAK